jgi:hypothetical protein
MFHGKLAQMGLYLPKVGFNTKPGGFVIVQKEDDSVCVTHVLDVTTLEAVIVNWCTWPITLDFDAPTITESSIRHQTEIFQSEAIAVVSPTSINDLAVMFHCEEAVAGKLDIHGIGNSFIL